MSIDLKWREKVEALRRVGLQYISREHVETSTDPEVLGNMTNSAAIEDHSKTGAEIAMTKKSKVEALKVLAEEVADCTKCAILCKHRTQTVFSDGTPTAEICFVGEAPGGDEDRQGIPFVGRAGQLLTKIIEACKLSRQEVYICNVLKCRPPNNRDPMPEEIENCRTYLERQLRIVQPKMMVALGKQAAAHLLGKQPSQVPITRIRGQIREYCGIPLMITLHPAYLLRNPSAKKDVWEDMKTVMRKIGRPVEG